MPFCAKDKYLCAQPLPTGAGAEFPSTSSPQKKGKLFLPSPRSEILFRRTLKENYNKAPGRRQVSAVIWKQVKKTGWSLFLCNSLYFWCFLFCKGSARGRQRENGRSGVCFYAHC